MCKSKMKDAQWRSTVSAGMPIAVESPDDAAFADINVGTERSYYADLDLF